MRTFVFASLLLFLAFEGLSQTSYGVRMGIVSSRLTFNEVFGTRQLDGVLGYQVGVFAEKPIKDSKLFLQPEVLYTRAEGHMLFGPNQLEFVFRRLNVPVNVGYKKGEFRFTAGPSFHFLFDGSWESDLVPPLVNIEYNGFVYGYQLGFGLHKADWVFDIRYEGSFNRSAKVAINSPPEFDLRLTQWNIGVTVDLMRHRWSQ